VSIDAVAALESASATAHELPFLQPSSPNTFESVLSSVGELNSQLLAREQSVAQLALGKTDNLHQVVMGAEQTRLAFELMLSVRNKVLDAYQELMRMQV
jgi:flagellar hook-basal body complex protein FliE